MELKYESHVTHILVESNFAFVYSREHLFFRYW